MKLFGWEGENWEKVTAKRSKRGDGPERTLKKFQFFQKLWDVLLEGVPEDTVVDDVIAVSENIASADNAMTMGYFGERLFVSPLQTIHGFTNNFKFTLYDQLKSAVFLQIRGILSFQKDR